MKNKRNEYASFASIKEAISKIKINLSFIDIEKKMKCIMVTSSAPNEGKSIISAEFARSLASDNTRVLLIDADMRKPTQHTLFNLKRLKGLSNIISTNSDWRESINRLDNNLNVISSGQTPPNPADMLASKKMSNILADMRSQYDFIIIDTPPILPVPDAVALSRYVDGIILIARHNKTTKKNLEEARHALDLAKAPLIGAILNDVRSKNNNYKYSY